MHLDLSVGQWVSSSNSFEGRLLRTADPAWPNIRQAQAMFSEKVSLARLILPRFITGLSMPTELNTWLCLGGAMA